MPITTKVVSSNPDKVCRWLATGWWFSPWLPWHNWNIVESGIKYHIPINQLCYELIQDIFTDTPLERRIEQIRQHYSIDHTTHPHVSPPDSASCKSSILFMVLHGGKNNYSITTFIPNIKYESWVLGHYNLILCSARTLVLKPFHVKQTK